MGSSSALSMGVGTMIAAGIFTLSGLAVRDVGSGAILAFLIAAFVALLTAMVYCEFSGNFIIKDIIRLSYSLANS